MSIAAALAELEKSPALHDHLRSLQEFVDLEQRRREQFHRDFEGRRGEFINGQVHVPPSARPAGLDAIACTGRLLRAFVERHGAGEILGGKCLVHCQRNDYTPDLCFFGPAKAAAFTPGLRLFPPPDLAVETLSPSTLEHLRDLKWQDYARHGVGEYWILDPDERMVEQYVLPPGAQSYALQARLPEGARLESVVLAGFSAPVAALFDAQAANQSTPQALAGQP